MERVGPFGFDESPPNSGEMSCSGKSAVGRKPRKQKRDVSIGAPGPKGSVRRKSNPSKALTV